MSVKGRTGRMEQEKIPQDCRFYYLTSGGRVWGVSKDELVEGDAQKRREMLGNNFETAEEACVAKAQLEAWARLKKYAHMSLTNRGGRPVLEVMFDFSEDDATSMSDLRLVAGVYKQREQNDYTF